MSTHENIASKHATTHANQAPAAHRAPVAGSLRQRGSSKRNQGQKVKKIQSVSHDTKEGFPTNGSALEKRLALMRSSRLDLSLPRETQTATDPSVRNQSPHIQPFKTFPAIIIDYGNQGHHLTELWLTNHHMGTLPADIVVFRKLRVLGLSGNKLTALPEELNQLTALEGLFLDKNRLQTLPSKVTFPPHLRELRLDNNQLTVFPSQITKLRLLNRLGLSHNQIKVLPESIHRLRNLVEFDLDYNRLEADLPDGFAALQRLERLGLEGNCLAEKPAILSRLPVLSYIRLSGNRATNYLPPNSTVTGSTQQLLAVPKRHDGYFQCVESCNTSQDVTDMPNEKVEHRNLEGLIPCRDQNILNMLIYLYDDGILAGMRLGNKEQGRVVMVHNTNKQNEDYRPMAPSPSSSLSAFEHSTTQGGGDSKYDTTVEIPNVGDEAAHRCSWKQFMRDYRMVEFGCTAIIYALAGVFAAIEVIERPIPGIRVRLNSTAEVWSLDPAIGEKKLTQEVPMWLLMLLGIGLPVGTNLVVNYALPRFCAVRIIDHDIRDFLLSLFQSIALATFLTQFTKNMTGRFRPCFYDMCGWNHDIIWDGVTNLCTSTSGEKEGRKSFPSGHASFSWSTMLVLTLYLLGRSRLNCTNRCNSMLRSGKKSVMMFLCCVPLLLAAWICITRSIDNWHHYSDILAGSVVGAASAIFAFSNNYGPIFSWRYAGLPIETIHDRIKQAGQLNHFSGSTRCGYDGNIYLLSVSSSQIRLRDYRILDFAFTGIIYLVAFVCSLIEVHERPIPGIRYRLNSTAVAWGLDPSIDKKMLVEEVPMWLALVLGIGLPAGINLAVNFVLPKFCQVRVIAHDTRDFLLSLFQSIAFASLFTQFTKNITGRFRPSFYDMCKWNYDVVWDGVANLCTDAAGEKEGRKSFPSGHASCSWATMLTLTLYLVGRFRLNTPSGSKFQRGRKTMALAFCCLPLLLAVWICVTRSTDNWHHYSDILGGSVIGAGAAIAAFNSNYGSVFSWDVAGLPIETIHEQLKQTQKVGDVKV